MYAHEVHTFLEYEHVFNSDGSNSRGSSPDYTLSGDVTQVGHSRASTQGNTASLLKFVQRTIVSRSCVKYARDGVGTLQREYSCQYPTILWSEQPIAQIYPQEEKYRVNICV